MLTPGFNRWGHMLLHFGTSPAALVRDGEMVRVAADRYAKGETMAELAEVYGVFESTISTPLNPFAAGASL
jgi:hypothetical protein